ncbi:MAG TPA: hypothetical protein VK211_21650 [Kamptonema sp.]|nr:hypothetical protein [Kamptonema sp.]
MDISSYLIAKISFQPGDRDKKPLLLNYNPKSELGFFCYGNQRIQLSYSYEETVITNSFPTGSTRRNIRPMQPEIPCSTWVNYFSDWQIDEDQLYYGCRKLDSESDTGRVVRDFSGFDNTIGVWECTWQKRDMQDVYNTTFEHLWSIELRLNLLNGTGNYDEYKYTNYT